MSRPFQILDGNRRTSPRSETSVELGTQLDLSINNVIYSNVKVVSMDYGRMTIVVSGIDVFNHQSGEIVKIKLEQQQKIIGAGSWRILQSRKEVYSWRISLEMADYSRLKEYFDTTEKELYLNPSYHRLLDHDDELVALITLAKDLETSVPCEIESDGIKHQAHFDFSSGSISLDQIDVSLPLSVEQLRHFSGSTVKVGFNLFSVRYIFNAKVKEIDEDFGLVSLVTPLSILAITNRRFYRWKCNKQLTIKFGNRELQVQCQSIAVNSIELAVDMDLTTSTITILLPTDNGLKELECKGLRKSESNQIFLFERPVKLDIVCSLFSYVLDSKLVFRNSKNYDAFIKLYKEVGYGPEPSNEAKWTESTIEAWKTQDQLLPGNTVGALDTDHDLSLSMSNWPISNSIMYGHSLAMSRNESSARQFYDAMDFNLNWIDLISGVTSYLGSARTTSRFSSKMHTYFEHAPIPFHFKVFRSAVFFTDKILVSHISNFHFHSISLNEISTKLENNILEFIADLSQHRTDGSSTTILRSVTRHNSTDMIALLVEKMTPTYFSAANALRCVWLFAVADITDLQELVNSTHAACMQSQAEIDVIDNGKIKDFDELAKKCDEEVIWYHLPTMECGSVIHSLHLATYRALKKYSSTNPSQNPNWIFQ